ncbi:glucokinase [Alkalilimnicola ehrlichii]|uniref:Glucokinase n=1 Tax=Alkalilimnicola ehrlichii TaxID=351052 RepID=A0A3E0WHN2_9GAMM|nr:glucokinase [Alkalilimnicola ehrlichii]RFA25301.1 glucokinase [Alkalilimnicola ehrlichii]RFA32414.1 glucokinase [Alkalilimnicola ehrlichii]
MSIGHPNSRWLLADIGGTNARFAIAEAPGADPSQEKVLACADYPTLVDAIRTYLAGVEGEWPRCAAMAIATPVFRDWVKMTNHHWAFSIEQTRQALELECLKMVNDFTAQAMAVRHLNESELRPLGGGEKAEDAPIAVLGPGTGLGVSGLIPTGTGDWIPLQTEGGHASFSPVTDREIAVFQVLRKRYPHVSVERILSGSGLTNLYHGIARVDDQHDEQLSPPEIVRRAQDGSCSTCREAVAMFVDILGNVTGNLILTLGARGGFFICGGIPPKLGSLFDIERFRQRLEDHGRFKDYLREVPGHLVLAKHPALLGLSRGMAHETGAMRNRIPRAAGDLII